MQTRRKRRPTDVRAKLFRIAIVRLEGENFVAPVRVEISLAGCN